MKILIASPHSIWEQGNRKNQEDAIYPRIGEATANDKVFLLCDGMGGMSVARLPAIWFAMSFHPIFRSIGMVSILQILYFLMP